MLVKFQNSRGTKYNKRTSARAFGAFQAIAKLIHPVVEEIVEVCSGKRHGERRACKPRECRARNSEHTNLRVEEAHVRKPSACIL